MNGKDRRLTIALYISETDNEYSNAVLKGACLEAEKRDVNMIVFPVKYIDAPYADKQRTQFEWQPNSFLSYAMNNSVDGVIIDAGSIGCYIDSSQMKQILDNYKDVPVISIAKKIEGYRCLEFNSDGIKDELRHLYYYHGRRKIGIINGPMCSSDAQARFRAYKEALEECGLEYDERRVGEGRFSIIDDEYVEQMLQRCNDDIDALMFANDDMAFAGYRVLAKHGFTVGKDILVTGFDDSPKAMEADPPLTTIHTDIKKLGSQAVDEITDMLTSVHHEFSFPKASMIVRGSCGCKSVECINDENMMILGGENVLSLDECRKYIKSIITDIVNTSDNSGKVIDAVCSIFFKILSYATDDSSQMSKSELENLANTYFDYDMAACLNENAMLEFISQFRRRITLVALNPSRARNSLMAADMISKICHDKFVSMRSTVEEKQKRMIWQTNNFMGIAVGCMHDINNMYYEFLHKISDLGIKNAYFYMHEKVMNINSVTEWKQPSHEVLYAYIRDGEIIIPDSIEKRISADMLFKNKMMPSHRTTFCAALLSFTKINYGFLLGEIDAESVDFFIRYTAALMSDAIMFADMYSKQQNMMNLLEKNLSHTSDVLRHVQGQNESLSRKSQIDGMTGIYNRRGFEETVNEMLSQSENTGKKAVVIFADLDNLKKINDMYGHADGDTAIRTAALILNSSMRKGDITARFGGDEFAAFAVSVSDSFENEFRKRVNDISYVLNKQISKSYKVSISLGIDIFIIDEKTSLDEQMKKADLLLYSEKRRKKTGRDFS